MILIFGGTTEGRIAAETADEAGKPFYYSTRGTLQEVNGRNLQRLTGGMDKEGMVSFCRQQEIKLIIDAAHPFAQQLHNFIYEASQELNIKVIRLERIYPALPHDVVLCEDYNDAIVQMERDHIDHLLALTGTQTIQKLKPFWEKHHCIFRVLDRAESVDIARKSGYPEENLIFYDPTADESKLAQLLSPQAIITKESGLTGGFMEKMQAAEENGIKLYVVRRPKLPNEFITVTGKYGLRRAIEQQLPEFYPLRSGYTTGSCATAAAKSALLALIDEHLEKEVDITLPDGESISISIHQVEIMNEQTARAAVIKDAGDDPDVTHGHEIVATVSFSDDPKIHFLQGQGVGVVTLPGLGLPIGGPAINKTPREMITSELSAIYSGGLDVTISVPDGEALAQKTFNPKLGIVGGISIIGTSGIVRPFSSEAFVDAIRREVEVAKAIGAERLVINSGAKSERFVKSLYLTLPSQAFVHYGNFIGETLKVAAEIGFSKVSMGIMIGKAVKLAEGNLDTHSKKVVMNKEFLQSIAQEVGCSDETVSLIEQLTLARELWEMSNKRDKDALLSKLVELCAKHCSALVGEGELTILLISEQGEIPYQATTRKVL